MITRTWTGTSADFYTAGDWLSSVGPNGYPLPGDTAMIDSGVVQFIGSEAKDSGRFDDQTVSLGAQAPELLFIDALAGQFFNVTLSLSATLEAAGVSGFAGGLTDTAAGGTLTIGSMADPGGTAGNFVLLRGPAVTLTGGATLDLEGTVTEERSITTGIADPLVNNATVNLLAGTLDVQSRSFTGTGTVRIGVATTAFFEGAVPATQTIAFTGADGKLKIAAPAQFAGHVTAYAPKAIIDLTTVTGNAASYSATARTITVSNNGTTVATLRNVDAAAGALVAASDGGGGTNITYAGTGTRLSDEITVAARAERADVVRTMTVPGTQTPITGAGIRIGIISDSFDEVTPGSANGDAALGYLPAKANGTSAVTVLQEGPSGSEDEGRAMAELVHQIAPGASLYFYTGANGAAAFATGVTALQQAGCNIILDDITVRGQEPFFQVAGPIDTAIANAIAAGSSYFALASNFGNAYYEHSFSTTARVLPDGSAVQAMSFANGTALQSITLSGATTTTIDLQWDAPFYPAAGGSEPDAVAFKVFDANGTLVGTSSQKSVNGQLVSESELVLTTTAAVNDQIAIYQNASAPVSLIKYVLFGRPTGAQSPGGTINDPDAGTGGGLLTGHALVPGAVTVAASFAPNSPAFGQPADFLEPFSVSGPGEILFDASGNRLTSPISANKVDVTGADGVYTSLGAFQPFYGTSAATPDVAAVAALMLQVNPSLTPAQIKSLLQQSAISLGQPASYQGSGLVQADQAVLLAEGVACFVTGTMIGVPGGEMPVERLAIGDAVATADGGSERVRWIGRRSYAGRFLARQRALWPVRITAGALADGVPVRDLLVSPRHALAFDGVLIAAEALVNGTTVRRVTGLARVDYLHVELFRHAVILAEGTATESFCDEDSRGLFVNAAEFAALYPDAEACLAVLPRVDEGHALEQVRRAIQARVPLAA